MGPTQALVQGSYWAAYDLLRGLKSSRELSVIFLQPFSILSPVRYPRLLSPPIINPRCHPTPEWHPKGLWAQVGPPKNQ